MMFVNSTVNSTEMKVKFINPKGQLVQESQVRSMNHYQMLLKQLKKNQYSVEFTEGGISYTRTITVK